MGRLMKYRALLLVPILPILILGFIVGIVVVPFYRGVMWAYDAIEWLSGG